MRSCDAGDDPCATAWGSLPALQFLRLQSLPMKSPNVLKSTIQTFASQKKMYVLPVKPCISQFKFDALKTVKKHQISASGDW